MGNISSDSTKFSKWAEAFATILSQNTSVYGYTPLSYLVIDYAAAKTWNISDPNLPDPEKLAAVERMEG